MNITFGAISPRYKKLENHFTEYVTNHLNNSWAGGRTINAAGRDGFLKSVPDWQTRQVAIAKILKESNYKFSRISEIITEFAEDKKIAPNYLTKLVRILAKLEEE